MTTGSTEEKVLEPISENGFWKYLRRPESPHPNFKSQIAITTGIRVIDDPSGIHARQIVKEIHADMQELERGQKAWDAKNGACRPEDITFEELVDIAAQFGVPYLPADELIELGIDVVIERIRLLEDSGQKFNLATAMALLGEMGWPESAPNCQSLSGT
jgi:hypothetical protein